MHNRFLASLRESPFIEGMGRILDFTGIIERDTVPVKSDAEALNEDWEKVMGDYKHSIILVEERSYAGEKNKQR